MIIKTYWNKFSLGHITCTLAIQQVTMATHSTHIHSADNPLSLLDNTLYFDGRSEDDRLTAPVIVLEAGFFCRCGCEGVCRVCVWEWRGRGVWVGVWVVCMYVV